MVTTYVCPLDSLRGILMFVSLLIVLNDWLDDVNDDVV